MVKWECKKCGMCCEVLMPNCKNYKNSRCSDYLNRPWMCRQKLFLGDEFAIDTCRLIQYLGQWKRKTKDKAKVERVVKSVINSLFGASDEQKCIIKEKITEQDIEEIKHDTEKYIHAFAKGG